MSVYVDRLLACVPSRRWPFVRSCHLFADTVEELHQFAAGIGLRRCWFQNKRSLPHYDLNGARREAAIRAGAIEADRLTVMEHINRWRSVSS